MIPVVLSGGNGTRLWPVSRAKFPKQFCDLFEGSLHSLTIDRLSKFGNPWVITNQDLKHLTEADFQKRNLDKSHILCEPFGKNTAPAIAFLCHVLQERGIVDDAVIGVFPADHLIEQVEKFYNAIYLAQEQAVEGKVVLVGIKPTRPETGFGYIQVATEDKELELRPYPVARFHEKPNVETAKQFIADGNYLWNAGMFVFRLDVMQKMLHRYLPNTFDELKKLRVDFSNLAEIYQKVEAISLDYAVMEKLKSNELVCIPSNFGWNDVGTWDAVAELDNEVQDNVFQVASSNNYVRTNLEKTYAFIDVNDLLLVDVEDATLICKKGSTQKVKDIVEKIKPVNAILLDNRAFELRPWGRFEILRDNDKFKSKIIQVKPKSQISYQSHSKREEHWIIVSGQGDVIIDGNIIPVKPGTHIHIPVGVKHRIRNLDEIRDLEFVEVQLGSYFGEDDIVRYEDDFGRHE